MYKTREEVENWLKEMGIENYIINEDLTVDVKGDVNISFERLKEIPVQFGIVEGDFYCYNNELTSLEGCPKEVKGSFNCYDNNLINLEDCPEVIHGDFDCGHNNLTSFKFFPKEIKGSYISIYGNKIREEDLVNFNCKMENVELIYSDFNEDRNKEEFLEKVSHYKNIKKENELLKELSIASSNVKLNKKL